MNELRRVYEPAPEPVSVAELVMFSDVRLIEDYETEGHHLPRGKVGALVERFSTEDSGVEYDDPQTVLIIPTRLLQPA